MRKFSGAKLVEMHGLGMYYAHHHRSPQSWLASVLDRFRGDDRCQLIRGPVTESDRAKLSAEFREGALECAAMDFKASSVTFAKMVQELRHPRCRYEDIFQYGRELHERVRDDARLTFFLSLSAREADLYTSPRAGWEEVASRFPAATTDIEEMSKCFALGRYAAAVFHSVQLVEVGLAELCKALESKDPQSGWTAAAKALEKVVNKKHQDRTDFERKHFAFFEQVQGTVEGLKNAWRNKISHAHGKLAVLTSDFAPDVAEEIIFASRAFMRRLATDGPTAHATILDFPAGQDRREVEGWRPVPAVRAPPRSRPRRYFPYPTSAGGARCASLNGGSCGGTPTLSPTKATWNSG